MNMTNTIDVVMNDFQSVYNKVVADLSEDVQSIYNAIKIVGENIPLICDSVKAVGKGVAHGVYAPFFLSTEFKDLDKTEEEMTFSEGLETHTQLSAATITALGLCVYTAQTGMLTEAATLFLITNLGSYLYEARMRSKKE